MGKIKSFQQFNESNVEFDYDYICDKIRMGHGWGDAAMNNTEDFEKSEYYDNPQNDDEYIAQFNKYLTDIQFGNNED